MGVLTLRRTGEFTITTSGPHPCGIKNPQLIRYDVSIKCKPVLDARGFLVDQVDVHKYFTSMRSTTLSCELLAIRVTKDLRKIIMAEHPTAKIKGIDVTLSADPFAASMTYSWKAEKSKIKEY